MKQVHIIAITLEAFYLFALTSSFSAPLASVLPITDADWTGMNDFGLPGTNGNVYAFAFGMDGSLYAGGKFSIAGKIAVNNIVKWDGVKWNALGSGTDNTVYSLACDAKGNLYAGGDFVQAGGIAASHIAKWDGHAWSALDSGVNGRVTTLAIDSSGNLYAGGLFVSTGGLIINHIAKWDGSNWNSLGSGVNGNVSSLITDTLGNIYVGGSFTMVNNDSISGIAKWNGNNWGRIGGKLGSNTHVSVMALNNKGVLYVYGAISINGEYCQVAKSNGVGWSQVGLSTFNVFGQVNSLACDAGGDLYVAGFFDVSNDVVSGPSHNLVRCDHESVGDFWIPSGGTNDTIFVIAFDKNGMHLGGSFTQPGSHIAPQLNSCLNGAVNALSLDVKGNLYAGGEFTAIPENSAKYAAKWIGNGWSALGLGVNKYIKSIVSYRNGRLFCGGYFDTAGAIKANGIAQWNGVDWSAIGSGLNGNVQAIAVDKNGDLYAGGNFDSANNVALNNIAKWDGNSWKALGTGLDSYVFALSFDSTGNLYAGGNFIYAGGKFVNFIAKWNGSEWSPLGPGLNYTIYSIVCDNHGNLYVGGAFNSAGGGFEANCVAKWDGAIWSSLGSGLSMSDNRYTPYVRCIDIDNNGNIFCGGNFDSAGSVSARNIAKWNGGKWEPLGSGVNGNVFSFALSDSTLYVGGGFGKAGNLASPNIAKVNIHNIPMSSIFRPNYGAVAGVHYRVVNSTIVFSNLFTRDRISLYSLSGRCMRQADGVSVMNLTGIAPQPLFVRVSRKGKVVSTGMVMVQ
jgi:hypothetical protein